MEDQWKGKNVNLSTLSEHITQFFARKEFGVSHQEKNETYVVVAAPKPFHNIAEKIRVTISGNPNEFSVKFTAGAHSRAFVRYGTFLALFGFGFMVPKGLKSLEEIEKLEKDFWVYVDETIWQLTNSK